MGLALLKSEVSQSDVEVAWATYHALSIAEHDDTRLLDNAAHRLAKTTAQVRFLRLYDAWVG
jgi:hypothetical protein